jgi:hypothetical protein
MAYKHLKKPGLDKYTSNDSSDEMDDREDIWQVFLISQGYPANCLLDLIWTPGFKRNASTDLIRQCAVECERSREASQNARAGMIRRMQFTFSVDTLLAHSRLRRVYHRYRLFI